MKKQIQSLHQYHFIIITVVDSNDFEPIFDERNFTSTAPISM